MPKKLEEDVRAAFDRATEDAGSPEALLTAVRILVRDLKKEGRPPENVIVTIKRLCGVSQITVAADTDSNAVTSGPWVRASLFITRTTASMSSASTSWRP